MDAQVQRPDQEIEVDIIGHHPGIECQARALAGAGVVVLQLDAQRTGCRGQINTQTQLRLGAKGQGDIAFTGCIQKIGQAWRQFQPGQFRNGLQIQCQRESVLVAQFQIEIDEQLVEGGIEDEVDQVRVQPQGLFDQALGLIQAGCGIRAQGLQRGEPLVTDRDDTLDRLVDHRQRLGVEGLVLDGASDEIQTDANRAHDVRELQVVEAGELCQIRQDQHHIVRAHQALGQGLVQVKAIQRVDRCEFAPVQQVLDDDAQLQRFGDRDGVAAGKQAHALEARRSRAFKFEGDGTQCLAKFFERKTTTAIGKVGTATGLGRAVQCHTSLCCEPQTRARAWAASHDPGKAQSRQHLQVLDVQAHPGRSLELVDGQVELVADHQYQVKAGIQVDVDLTGGLGGQLVALVGTAETELDRCRQRREGVRKTHWYLELVGLGIEAGLVLAEQARLVERRHELIHGLDALNGLVHLVALWFLPRVKGLGQGQRAAVFGHRADLHGLAAHADPETFHGSRKLTGFASHAQTIGSHGGRSLGQLRLPGSGRPGHERSVEVELVDHRCLEGRGQVQHARERLLHKGQITQAQGLGIESLQRFEHLGHGRQHIDEAELGHLGELVKVGRLDTDAIRACLEHVAFERDQGGERGFFDQLDARDRAIQRQLDQHRSRGVLELELTIDQGQPATEGDGGLTLAPVLAFVVLATATNARLNRAQSGAHHEVLGGQLAIEAQRVDVELSPGSPVQLEVEVQRSTQGSLHRGLAVELQTQAVDLRSQVQAEAQIALEHAVKVQGKARAAQAHAQAFARFQLLLEPGFIEVAQHAPEGRLCGLAVIHRWQVHQTGRIALDRKHRLEVVQHVVAHAQNGREVQQLVQRLTDHRQGLTLAQLGGRIRQVQGHIGQFTADVAADGGVDFAQAEVGRISRQVHLEQSTTDGEFLLDLRTGEVEIQAKFTKGLHAADPRQAEHGRGIHGQCKALGLEQHEHAAIAHAGLHVCTQVDFGPHLGAGQHQVVVLVEQLEVTASGQQRRAASGRIRTAQGQVQRGRGFQNTALLAEREQILATHLDGCEAIALAIAIDVALGEIDRAARQRPLAETGGEGQTHAAGFGRQAGHAFERELIGLGLQAHEGPIALGVLQQHQAHRAAFELHAQEALRIRFIGIQTSANVDILCRNRGQRHGPALAVVKVNRACTRAAEGEGASQAEHAADLQRGIGHQRDEVARRHTVVQLHRGSLPTRRHTDGARTGQVHDLLVGSTIPGAQRQVGLHSRLAHRELEVLRQTEILGLELNAVDRGLQRQPAALVPRQRVLGRHERQAQAQVFDLHALHGGIDIGGTHHEGDGLKLAATHGDGLFLAYHREVAAGRQDIAQGHVHVAADGKQFALESHFVAVAVAIGHKQRVFSPIQCGLGISQRHVDVQRQIPAAQAQAIGFGAHKGQFVDGAMQAQPAARVMGGDHQGQLQAAEFETQRVRTGRSEQMRTETGTAHDQQVGIVQSAAIGEFDAALFALELSAAAKAHRITQAGLHGALDKQQHTVAALHVQTQ